MFVSYFLIDRSIDRSETNTQRKGDTESGGIWRILRMDGWMGVWGFFFWHVVWLVPIWATLELK